MTLSTNKNTATSIYERMGVKIRQSVTMDIGGVDFKFYLDAAAYDTMQNDIMPDNKVTPMKDYLLAIVEPEQRQTLAELLQIPGFAANLATEVNEVLIPKVEIKVKN
ncbi:TPA: putative phage tail assembly chaperone [Pasteurella multocida]|nr:putative phage tail assembly chaperone [Pasteurella multocida]HED4406659.1 putative phage tail assembly chaperone [Pasteurella multocida]